MICKISKELLFENKNLMVLFDFNGETKLGVDSVHVDKHDLFSTFRREPHDPHC